MWLDYTAVVGTLTPNPGTIINLGLIWPTWDSAIPGSGVFVRQTLIPV